MFKKIIVVIWFVFGVFHSFCQTQTSSIYLDKMDTVIELNSLIDSSQFTVVFCLPVNNESKEVYNKKINELLKDPVLGSIKSLNFKVVYFKLNEANLKKGFVIRDSSTRFKMNINQFESFFIGCEAEKLGRASRISEIKFEVKGFGDLFKFQTVQVVDPNICFGKLSDRIPTYKDLILEAIFPKYTADERLDILNETLVNIKQQLNSMETEIIELKKCNESLIQLNKELLELIKSTEQKKK